MDMQKKVGKMNLTAGSMLQSGFSRVCPRFREKITDLNDITNYYSGQLDVYLIYGIEAHPIVDPSPYSGFLWVTSENYAEGVLHEQPETYGERLALIDSLQAAYTIVPDILVDGPCNEWWQIFGPAPNNAYLIDTNGIVVSKQGWFNRAPDNMWCEIDSLLGTSSGNCIAVGDNGTFSWTLDNDSTAYGVAGSVLETHGVLRNLSSTDNVKINITKQVVDVPFGWGTALCADICYSTSVTTATLLLSPSDSLDFTFYFYTGTPADSGFARLRFKNMVFASNIVYQQFMGVTAEANGIQENAEQQIRVYPNPSAGEFTISYEMGASLIRIVNIVGEVVFSAEPDATATSTTVHLGDANAGMYFYQIEGNGKMRIGKIIID